MTDEWRSAEECCVRSTCEIHDEGRRQRLRSRDTEVQFRGADPRYWEKMSTSHGVVDGAGRECDNDDLCLRDPGPAEREAVKRVKLH